MYGAAWIKGTLLARGSCSISLKKGTDITYARLKFVANASKLECEAMRTWLGFGSVAPAYRGTHSWQLTISSNSDVHKFLQKDEQWWRRAARAAGHRPAGGGGLLVMVSWEAAWKVAPLLVGDSRLDSREVVARWK